MCFTTKENSPNGIWEVANISLARTLCTKTSVKHWDRDKCIKCNRAQEWCSCPCLAPQQEIIPIRTSRQLYTQLLGLFFFFCFFLSLLWLFFFLASRRSRCPSFFIDQDIVEFQWWELYWMTLFLRNRRFLNIFEFERSKESVGLRKKEEICWICDPTIKFLLEISFRRSPQRTPARLSASGIFYCFAIFRTSWTWCPKMTDCHKRSICAIKCLWLWYGSLRSHPVQLFRGRWEINFQNKASNDLIKINHWSCLLLTKFVSPLKNFQSANTWRVLPQFIANEILQK